MTALAPVIDMYDTCKIGVLERVLNVYFTRNSEGNGIFVYFINGYLECIFNENGVGI